MAGCGFLSGKPIQDPFDISDEKGKVTNIFFQQLECKLIINGPVPVHDNIPETTHSMDLFLHRVADNPVSGQMVQDVLILSRDPEIEIGIDDGADIETSSIANSILL